MKIPEKLRIGGVDYAVKREERIISEEGRALVGQINYDQSLIRIEPAVQDAQGQCRTLLHEVLHGLEHHFKLDLEEDEIDSLANGLYMVVMDNPEIFQ